MISKNPETIEGDCRNYFSELLNLSLITQSMLKFTNNDLSKLGSKEYLEQVKNRILVPDDFEKLLYEWQIASACYLLGKKIEFTDESKRKWPDLKAIDSQTSFLECKKLDGPEHIYQRYLLVNLSKILSKMQKNVRVDIVLEHFPDKPSNLESLPEKIKKMLESNTSNQTFDEILVSIYEYQEKDILEDGIHFGDDSNFDHMVSSCESKKLESGKVLFRNPCSITIKCNEIPFPDKPIKRQISRAYKQLKEIPDDFCKILCIDITHFVNYLIVKKDSKSDEIRSHAVNYIESIFQSEGYSKLGGIILNWNISTNENGIDKEEFKSKVIINPSANNPIPEGWFTPSKQGNL